MMSKKLVVLVGTTLALGGHALAGDLESILDEGSKKAEVAAPKAAAVQASAFAQAIQKSIGKPTTEQNIFIRYVEASDWEKAVLQFPAAFEGTAYQKSSNGRALLGLMQFRTGLPVTGLQTLFMASNAKEINTTLREEWQKSAPLDHFAWNLASIEWSPSWEVVFGEALELRLKARDVASGAKGIEQLKALSAHAGAHSTEKALIDWQLVIAYSLNDQADLAAKLLAGLMKSPTPPVSADLMQITAARLLFQNGYFDAAAKYYEKVPKSSEYWTEAQEETGWSYIRKGEPNNAMAVSQSLVNPSLNYQISSEVFLVRSLAQLKVCDYNGVNESLQTFPKRFKERTKNLEALAASSADANAVKGIDLLKNQKQTILDLGSLAQNLPRRFSHDKKLYDFAQAQKHLEDEATRAEKIYAQSLALTGLQGSFEKLKQNTLQRAQNAKTAALGRVKDLAKEEVAETKDVLRKLHIIEVELIQQVSIADKIAKNAVDKGGEKKGVTGAKASAETVSYPAENEVWFDELSNYRVDIKKACTVKR